MKPSLVLSPMILPLATALRLLVCSDSKSLTAVSFTAPSQSSRAALSVLNRIPITTFGTLVADSGSPDVIFQVSPSLDVAPAFRVGVRQDNVTLATLAGDRSAGCMLSMYDGQKSLISQDEMRSIRRSAATKQDTVRLDDPVNVVPPQRPQHPILDGDKSHDFCPERLLEHNQGLSLLDSKSWTVKTLKRVNELWKLKSTINMTGGDYTGGVGTLAYGKFLYLLDPAAGALSRYFLSDPTVLAQKLNLNSNPTSLSLITGTILLSSRSSHFPSSYIYAAYGSTLLVIALPNDPSDDLHIIARMKTSLTNITTGMLVSDEGRYLVLGGEGGVRMYQRVMGGAAVVEIAKLETEDAVSSLLWL
ncbi:hypothetical protein FRC12_024756 [Ceratobasidium sp. 428]|nr:hypothetical protein FRC12_024756 [Ceratobasidium sp. 428]